MTHDVDPDGEDDLKDWEYPDEDDGDEWETIACPNCGIEVFDDAEQCPACRHYILALELRKPASVAGYSLWWAVILFLLVTALLWGILWD